MATPTAKPWTPAQERMGTVVIRYMSRANKWLYRLTGGWLGGTFFGAPVMFLTTVGRKSGEPRTVPLLCLAEGDTLVTVASKGGMSHHPMWYRNLAANPAVDVEFHTAIGECAHNIILLHTLRSCYRLLADGVFHNRLMIFSLPDARDTLLAQHLAIHEAVAAGDAEAARAASIRHIDFVERAMAEADRSHDWRRVSRLRLSRRRDESRKRAHNAG